MTKNPQFSHYGRTTYPTPHTRRASEVDIEALEGFFPKACLAAPGVGIVVVRHRIERESVRHEIISRYTHCSSVAVNGSRGPAEIGLRPSRRCAWDSKGRLPVSKSRHYNRERQTHRIFYLSALRNADQVYECSRASIIPYGVGC